MGNAKAELYRYVDDLKCRLGLNKYLPTDVINLCKNCGINIIRHSFDTKGLCAAAMAGKKHDTIVLNSNRTSYEQNFDCGHELIHLTRHRGTNRQMFNCFEKVIITQNSFIEWEANEGSAEFTVPYKTFLPMISNAYKSFTTYDAICSFEEQCAKHFMVSDRVIELRLESLKYEIYQYLKGTPLNELQLLSNSQQKREGIRVESIGALKTKLEFSEAIKAAQKNTSPSV